MTTQIQIDPFVQITSSFLMNWKDHDASDGALRLLLHLRLYADMNPDDQCWPGYDRLAEELGVSEKTIARYVKELHAHGLVRVQNRWCAGGNDKDVVFAKDREHREKTTNLYTVLRGGKPSPMTPMRGTPKSGGTVPPNLGGKEDTYKNTSYKHSKTIRPTTSPENLPPVDNPNPKKPAVPIAADWTPNKFNLSLALRLGLSADLDAHAYAFRLGAHQNHEKRDDWHKAFGRYLHAFDEGRVDVEFSFVDSDVITNYALDRWKAQAPAAPAPSSDSPTDITETRITRGEKTALNKITRYLGGLTESETAEARRMLADGIPWNVISTEIEAIRDRQLLHA